MLPLMHVPGDKSISHRALMFAALADGDSTIQGLLHSADVEATAQALRLLGCDVPPLDADTVRVRGVGLRGLRAPGRQIDCGNSGTTARLLLGILAGLDLDAIVTGDASLRSRPMARVTEPLTRMGARFEFLERPDRLPLRVRGALLRPFEYDAPHASAQVKSALLLAALVSGTTVSVREPRLSRDHTERMLRAQGVAISSWTDGERAVATLEPGDALRPITWRVPGDVSSAAFLLALGVLRDGAHITGVGINPARAGMLTVLGRMGAPVERTHEHEGNGEPVADLHVRPGPLRSTTIEPAEVPALIDEIPVIAVLAARANGTTRIRGAEELRVKETDRIRALVDNLRGLGVGVNEHADGLDVTGTNAPLSGSIRTFGDHRIAMAFGILGALPGNDVQLDDQDCVRVSYPGFWDAIRVSGSVP